MRRLSAVTAVAGLALALGGCASTSDATDSPRYTVEMVSSPKIVTQVPPMPYMTPSFSIHAAQGMSAVDPRCDKAPVSTAFARAQLRLPTSDVALLVRTDFSADAAWHSICTAATAENNDGYMAALTVVNDRGFDRSTRQDIRSAVHRGDQQSSVVFIVDQTAITSSEHPILVIDVSPRDGADMKPFRTIPSEVWSVENNLDLGNMDWEDFERAAGVDGIFRGS